mgnify:FL=1
MRTISGKNAAATTTSTSTAPATTTGETEQAPPLVGGGAAQPGDVEGETGAPVRPEGQTRRRSSLFGGLQKQDVWV